MAVMDIDTKVETPNWVEAPETAPFQYSRVESGVELTLLPESEDPKQEAINKRSRIGGLALLGMHENKKMLDKYLGEGKMRAKLVEVLTDNFEHDLDGFYSPERFQNPLGLSTLQSIYLGLGLKDAKSDAGQRIYRLALARSTDPDIEKALGILKTLPGNEYLAERF